MPIRVFTIPFDPHREFFQDEELRKFLLNKRVKCLRPEFFQVRDKVYWSVFLDYDALAPEGRHRVPEQLNDAQRLLFQRLREWRKETAEAEKIPVFIIATDSELIQVIIQAPRTLEALRKIRGFGKKKTERYGRALLELLKAFNDAGEEQKPSSPASQHRTLS